MEDLNRDATPPLKLMRSLVPTPCNTRSERPKRGRGGEVTLKWVPQGEEQRTAVRAGHRSSSRNRWLESNTGEDGVSML